MSNMNWSQSSTWAAPCFPSLLPSTPSTYITHLSQEEQTLDQLQNKGEMQYQPSISMAKYMQSAPSIPIGLLTASVSPQQIPHRQHQPHTSYGPHPPVEGSDPEGYQVSNTFSDAYSADGQRRTSQDHYGSDLFHNMSPFSNSYSIPRQSSPSSSEGGNSTYFGGSADGNGVIDPSLLKSEQDHFVMDDTSFDQSYFNSPDLSIDETEEMYSNNGMGEDILLETKDHGLCFGPPHRTDTTMSHMSMATTVVAEHGSPPPPPPPDCSECKSNYTATEQSNTTSGTNGSTPSNRKRGKTNGSSNANTHRRRKSSASSGSESSYSDNNGEHNSRNKSSKVTKKKKTKSQCRECHRFFPNQSELRKHTETHSKPYRCMYDNCQNSFGARNEWKRHVTSMHFKREVYKCTEARCQSKSIFNRRDLFAKHVGRMHGQTASFDRQHKDYERSKAIVSAIADRSKIKHEGPGRCTCGFCGYVFQGEGDILNKMLDHVGQHFQNNEECSQGEWVKDTDVEAWLNSERMGVKKNHYVEIKHEDDDMDADGEIDD